MCVYVGEGLGSKKDFMEWDCQIAFSSIKPVLNLEKSEIQFYIIKD